MSNVLITGASGFLGEYIIECLKSETDANVLCIDIRGPTKCDFTDYNQLLPLTKDFKIDQIIHLGAIAAPRQCDQNPDLAFKANVLGTYNMLKLAKLAKVKKFVFASSAHVYQISPKFLPTPENHPLYPMDTYTSTKIIGEQMCKLFWDSYSLPYTCIRLYNSYGPHQSSDYFIPAMIEKAKKGDFTVKGEGITKDFVYVTDVARAYVKATFSDYVGEVNIGTGVQTRLGKVAFRIFEAFGAKGVEILPSDDSSPTNMQADITRAEKVLNWKPQINLAEGLDKTIASYR